MIWLDISAALMVVTACAHSWLGERRLIGPAIAARHGYLGSSLNRQITRYAWHAMSGFVLGLAATVVWPETPRGLVLVVGALWLAIGLAGLAMTRGRHVGWPVISGAGLAAIIGAQA